MSSRPEKILKAPVKKGFADCPFLPRLVKNVLNFAVSPCRTRVWDDGIAISGNRHFSRARMVFRVGKAVLGTQKSVKLPKGGASASDLSGTVKPCFALEFQGYQRP